MIWKSKYIIISVCFLVILAVIIVMTIDFQGKTVSDKQETEKELTEEELAQKEAAEKEALKLNWKSLETKNIFWPGFGVAYGNGLWIGIGTSSAKNFIGYSRNGYNWESLPNKNIFINFNGENGKGIAFGKDGTGKDLWVAVGEGRNNAIATSPDGFIWSGKGTSIFYYGRGVAFGKDGSGKDLWVAVGDGNNDGIAISSDGINWTGLGKSIIYSGYNVAYGNGLWVVVGYGDDYSIATSSDGKNWIGVAGVEGSISFTGEAMFSNGLGISYGKDDLDRDLWVAVGEGTINSIAYSSDGKQWFGLGKDIFLLGKSVAFGKNSLGKNLWVAVGEGNNSIATSYDGKTWLGLGKDIFLEGNSVAFGKDGDKKIFVAVGSDGGEGKVVKSSIAVSTV